MLFNFFLPDAVFTFVFFFPILLGMIFAFLAGKRMGLLGSTQSDAIWHGYGRGNYVTLLTIIAIGILITIVVCFSSFKSAIEFFTLGFLGTLFYMALVLLVGLVLFTMSAFIGYGIGRQFYTVQMMELEAKRSAEELKLKIERKEKAKPRLS